MLMDHSDVPVLPRYELTAKRAVLLGWLKAEGNAVEAGDLLAVLLTEDGTFELRSECAGVISGFLVAPGAIVLVHQRLAIISRKPREGSGSASTHCVQWEAN